MKNRILASMMLALLLLLIAASVVAAESIYIPFTAGGTEQEANLFPYTLDPNATEPQAHIAAIAPYASAPECANHDDRKWHGMWDGNLGCFYNHTHADNPHTVDDIFGTGYTDIAGGDISYPWETDMENHHKHTSYKVFVRRDLPCYSQYADGCIRAFRAQTHADLTNVVSDHHSYSIEALVCPEATPNDCGIVRFGGWQAVGDFNIDRTMVIDRPEPPRAPRPVQNHGWQIGNPNFATWYSISPSAIIRITPSTGDMWGYYEIPDNPPVPASEMSADKLILFCNVDVATGIAPSGCRQNGTYLQPHLIGVSIPQRHRATLDPDGNGVLDYQGYVDRYGAFVQGCTNVGLDCIPVSFENVRLTSQGFQFRGLYQEYDVTPAGASWIRYPQ